MLAHSPQIVTNGLVLCLDAANPKNYNLTEVEVLVVAGGGGGGTGGGGGGAGGLIYNSNFAVTPGTQLTVTVGGGGGNASSWGTNGGSGGNSVFGSLEAIGGGAGLHRAGATNSGTGGSGGGDAGGSGYTLSNATAGQGFSGGNSPKNGDTFEEPGGGGGGAGGVGQNASTPIASDNATVRATSAGAGGPGLGFSISGISTYYAGGGGGSNRIGVGKPGGIGGGGTGGASPTAGSPNTGGGGGGTGYGGYGGGGTSAAGGSGIIIVRYPGSQRAIGGTITSNNGYTIHTFTTSGTFTPNGAPGTGTILTDFSNNGNSGTLVNGVGYSASNGGSLVFDGSNDYATTSSSVLPSPNSSPLTLEAFCMNTSGSGWQTVLGTHSSFTQISFYGTTFNFGRNGGGGNLLVSSGVSVPINTWCHIVMTYDGSLGYGYLNGSFITSGNIGSNGQTNGVSLLSTYTSALPGEVFAGRIAVARVYNRALTAAEVSQNFNALRGRFGI